MMTGGRRGGREQSDAPSTAIKFIKNPYKTICERSDAPSGQEPGGLSAVAAARAAVRAKEADAGRAMKHLKARNDDNAALLRLIARARTAPVRRRVWAHSCYPACGAGPVCGARDEEGGGTRPRARVRGVSRARSAVRHVTALLQRARLDTRTARRCRPSPRRFLAAQQQLQQPPC